MFSSTRQYIDTTAATRRSNEDKYIPNSTIKNSIHAGKQYRHKVENNSILYNPAFLDKRIAVNNIQDTKKLSDNSTSNILTEEIFAWNSDKDLMANVQLRDKWIKIFQISENICFSHASDMQDSKGKKENSMRLRDMFKNNNDQYFLVSGVFQNYDGAKINPIVNASDWAVLTAQLVDIGNSKTSHIVLNEICRAFTDKTIRSPT